MMGKWMVRLLVETEEHSIQEPAEPTNGLSAGSVGTASGRSGKIVIIPGLDCVEPLDDGSMTKPQTCVSKVGGVLIVCQSNGDPVSPKAPYVKRCSDGSYEGCWIDQPDQLICGYDEIEVVNRLYSIREGGSDGDAAGNAIDSQNPLWWLLPILPEED